jgi:hypothetical protein
MIQALRNLLKPLALVCALFLSGSAWADYCIPDYYVGTSDGDYIDGVELGDIPTLRAQVTTGTITPTCRPC